MIVRTLVLISVAVSSLWFCSEVDTYYCMNGTVISAVNNEVCIADDTGEAWVINATGLSTGERIRIKFDSCHTFRRKDDRIVDYNVIK